MTFSHQFVFAEADEQNEKSERHCIWWDDTKKWLMGSCKDIKINNGRYFLDIDLECPTDSKDWKDFDNNELINEGVLIRKTDRIAFGTTAQG